MAYMAPEVRGYLPTDSSTSSSEYTNLVDLWALGCIIYRLVTGSVPFPGPRDLIYYCDDKFPFPDTELYGITPAGAQFIRHLLQANPNNRLASSEALKHPWVSGQSL